MKNKNMFTSLSDLIEINENKVMGIGLYLNGVLSLDFGIKKIYSALENTLVDTYVRSYAIINNLDMTGLVFQENATKDDCFYAGICLSAAYLFFKAGSKYWHKETSPDLEDQ